MKNTLRQSMAWLHTWAGVLVGWILFFMFLTGTMGYFDTEIDRWMQPERPLAAEHVSTERAIEVGIRRLAVIAPDAEQWFINPPAGRENPDLQIIYRQRPGADGKRGGTQHETLSVATGEPVRYRETGGAQVLYRFHYELRYLPLSVADWIVGACAMFMLIAIVSGVIVHKKIFTDFFTFRPGKQQRSWLDAHNALSVVALPFYLMIAYSGLIFTVVTYMPLIASASYGPAEESRRAFVDELERRQPDIGRAGVGAPLVSLAPVLTEAARHFGAGQINFVGIRNPGDANARITIGQATAALLRNSDQLIFDGVSGALLTEQKAVNSTPQAVRDVFLGLHEGLFAGPVLRWLYFLSGLLGTVMIATGLVLWTVKRRAQRAGFGLTLVERLNVGTIVGLPIGTVAYFWANRLIPVTVEGRAAWEVHVMFMVWALMLIHAHCRPLVKAWVEQLWIAAGACVLLPVLNALTTERHLGVTLPRGDWVLAGFDLTILALGIAFAVTAMKVRSKFRIAPLAKQTRLRTASTAQAVHSESV